MLEWLTRLIRRVLPRVIPVDPETGGGKMLLFTLRPTGVLGDQNDGTTVLVEREDFQPSTIPFSVIGEMNPDGTVFPATFSHIIIHVRAQVADHRFNGVGDLLYANPSISWGWPFSDEPQDMNPQYTPVALWNELSLATRSIQLSADQHGNPWTFDSLRGIYAGAYVEHVTTQFGIEGYLEVADIWIDVYGTQDEPIRRSKFKPGTYSMTFNDTTYVTRATSDEVRSLYEAASAAKVGGVRMSVSFRAVTLDNGTISTPNPPAVNSTPAQLLAAIAAYADPVPDVKPL